MTGEDKEKFDAKFDEAATQVRRIEQDLATHALGEPERELTTREKLLRARPGWGSPEQATLQNMAAIAQMTSMKTKAQHQAAVNEQRRLAGIRSTQQVEQEAKQEVAPDE